MQYVEKAVNQLEKYIKPVGIKALTFLGLAYAAVKTYQLADFVHKAVLVRELTFEISSENSLNLTERYGEGTWVVITGGAQGIGAGFARALAQRKFNIVIMDINQDLLNKTKAFIEENYKVKVLALHVDFLKSYEPGFYDDIITQLKDLDISILINNVGIGIFGPYHDDTISPEKKVNDLLILNAVPHLLMSRKILPGMMNRDPKRRSAIINLASTAGSYPYKNYHVYSATKAYHDCLSKQLAHEFRDRVDVLSCRPLYISTAIIGHTPSSRSILDVDTFVSGALSKLGHMDFTSGHWKHDILNRLPFLETPINMLFFSQILKNRAEREKAAAAAAALEASNQNKLETAADTAAEK